MTEPREPEPPVFPSEVDDLAFDGLGAPSPSGDGVAGEPPDVMPPGTPAGGRPAAHRTL